MDSEGQGQHDLFLGDGPSIVDISPTRAICHREKNDKVHDIWGNIYIYLVFGAMWVWLVNVGTYTTSLIWDYGFSVGKPMSTNEYYSYKEMVWTSRSWVVIFSPPPQKMMEISKRTLHTYWRGLFFEVLKLLFRKRMPSTIDYWLEKWVSIRSFSPQA